MRSSSPALFLLLGVLSAGCEGRATDRALRQAWLVDAITDDNRVWLSREAAPLEVKYARMAADPYDFMRGTGGVAFRDWSRVTPGREETSFVEAAGSDAILLVGDPHPENVGTYLPGAGAEPTSRLEPIVLTLEANDFDGAGYGPWLLDVRRATQGLAVLLHQADCDIDCRLPLLEAWASAYVDELERQGRGEATWTPGRTGTGEGPVDRLVAESIEEGLHRQRVLDWTRPVADGLALRIDLQLDEGGRGTRPLTPEEAAQLDRLLSDYVPGAPAGFRVFDGARRYGSGIASVPAIRYAVAFDLGDPGPDDDGIVMFREVVDPPLPPGLVPNPSLRWDSNADRVLEAARTLWSRPDADPYAAALTDGAQTFKAVTGSSFAEGFDHLEVAELARFAPDRQAVLLPFAETLARQLASTHARSQTWTGEPALPILLADLEARQARFVAEVLRTAESDLEQTLIDHRLFAAALDELGPLLGAERLGTP